MGSNADIHFYTCLPSYVVLVAIFHFLELLVNQLNYRPDSNIPPDFVPTRRRALPPIDEFFMTLVRLRLGLLEQDLAHRFRISNTTVSRICTTWILFLDTQLSPLITWPSRTIIESHMPAQSQRQHPITRIIIDCIPNNSSIVSLLEQSAQQWHRGCGL